MFVFLKQIFRECILKCFRLLKKVGNYIFFICDFISFKKIEKQNNQRFSVLWNNRSPCLDDKTKITSFDRHYIYHLAWAARILKKTNPHLHIDLSSSLHFCTLISAFIPVEFYDYRPADLELSNLTSGFADLLNLPFEDESINSLSCMHVVEHVGLGRYGEPLDYDGDIKAINEMKRVIAVGGSVLFVVPVGKPMIMFNAHRIYSYEQIIKLFSGFQLVEFALIPDSPVDGGLVYNATKEMANAQSYGCGCFWFKNVISPNL